MAFRYYTENRARELSVKGTVKNLYNGDVEVYAQGDQDRIEAFEQFLHQGPPSAVVNSVVKNEIELERVFSDFGIIF